MRCVLACVVVGIIACVTSVLATYLLCKGNEENNFPTRTTDTFQIKTLFFPATPPDALLHHGKVRFTLKNYHPDRSLSLCFPTVAVYSRSSTNEFHKSEREVWPQFATERRVLLIPPLGQQVFEDKYAIVGGSGRPKWAFVFGPGDCSHEPDAEIFTGFAITEEVLANEQNE